MNKYTWKDNCKYCNKTLKGRQALVSEPICLACYEKRQYVREFMKKLEPIRKLYRERNQRIIEGVEFALDNGLDIPAEDLRKYNEIIERKKRNDR